ncbi:prolyl oligopeptidase family serine peptidase [Prevotella sp. P6B4]|uniref:S9 family peptidase n=1 Tax=Prevotella sp. P6B4 TaxID=1410614 RepID=UPI00048D94FC|nr:prolyl oligopeptidase family serine peptidase [Prevotella sp. P6B4]
MKKVLFVLFAANCALSSMAQVKTAVSEFNVAGPYAIATPFAIDTVDVQGKKFDPNSQLGAIALTSQPTGKFAGGVLPSLPDSKSVGVLSFYVNNADFIKGKVEVKGPKHAKLYIDGVEAGGELKLAPEHHTFTVQYLAEPKDTDSIQVVIDANKAVAYTLEKQHPYMVHDLTDGKRVRGINVSADGQLVCVSYQTTDRGGNSRWNYELRDAKTGKLISQPSRNPRWMPKSCAWLEEEKEGDKRVLYRVEPRTGVRSRYAYDVPEGGYTVAPTEDYLIITKEAEGPKEDQDVFEVLEMDDRQPGWRKRSYLVKYDVKTGISQRITFGNKGEYLSDISQDGSKLLIISNRSRLTKRPTTVSDVYVMDARTLQVDTLLSGAEFLGSGSFSPDGKQILFTGNPEAFNRIGCVLPASLTPSMTENELFLFDIASKQVTPLTKDFNPSVESVDWSWADGQVYFSAEDKDYVNIFTLNPKTGKITQLPIQGDYAYRFDMASQAPVLAYLSYKTMEPASAYVATVNSKKSTFNGQRTMFDGKEALGDAEIGTCQDWNFINSRGDKVYGRLYLPKDFDASKKYPMIVYYYGGCSPVSRYFESPYAPQYWNSLGYVAYILQPSGATGFGQEWASRHVNTAGRGPAEDIIEGTKKICEAHPFINKEKIGCMGASYGGFMTQYLQTQTDIFAAAVSHAGIANHTSYWGEGYWGYNYSEVSMANSYPWSHRQLYVDQSPLFNADKIHTPLLLLHGNADTNVPLIESLQMFTALKLLGREVALVEVTGENHHILDYAKKEKWLATQMAWFQKWLKDDPTWWDALYSKKHL